MVTKLDTRNKTTKTLAVFIGILALFLTTNYFIQNNTVTQSFVKSTQRVSQISEILENKNKFDSQSNLLAINARDTSPPSEITSSNDTSSDQTDYSQAIITPSPTFNLLSDNNINTIGFNAGLIDSFDLYLLSANNTYTIDTSNIEFSAFAIKWDSADLEYSINQDDFKQVPLADEVVQSPELYVSTLIELSEEVTEIRIRADKSVNKVAINFINPVEQYETPDLSLQTQGFYNRDSGAKYSNLNIISRSEWGANTYAWDPNSSSDIDDVARLDYVPYYHQISRIVVHHTAGVNNPSNPGATVRSIYLYHCYTLGWGDIGYNYLIDQWGNIYEGKIGGEGAYGYHAFTEANTMSIGISLLGTFSYVAPTAAAQNALVNLMAEKAAFYEINLKYTDGSLDKWLDTSYTVFGHRDAWRYDGVWTKSGAAATACPGNVLESLLPSLAASAQAVKYYSQNDNIRNAAAKARAAVQSDHDPDKLYVVFNIQSTGTIEQIEALIPEYSGITGYEINERYTLLYVEDWDTSAYGVIPPAGWTGYNPGTIPPSNGSDDRILTLFKIFYLDPNVKSVELGYNRELH
ncbi:N-acetylmuramoyl-L-alanine amidase [Candidatus Dojkabacteria bacterium]|nr:N-acetylmuramoyl-L-alanine amidase [Candidatus Dojkabacteria bacterium]